MVAVVESEDTNGKGMDPITETTVTPSKELVVMPKVKIPRKGCKGKCVDFTKLQWGALTDDWKSMGGRDKYKTLHDFAMAVVKRPKKFEPITVKRARFYKNMLVKGQGLSMTVKP